MSPKPTASSRGSFRPSRSRSLWIERFDTLEQLRARVRQFARDFNEHWLLERHGYRPRQARAALTQPAEAVA